MHRRQPSPSRHQVKPSCDKLGVDTRQPFASGRYQLIGDPDGQCMASLLGALTVEQHPLSDAEQPSAGLSQLGREVLDPAPGHQEGVCHHILGVTRVNSALHEADEVRVRRVVHLTKARLRL
jgi:hypothetical protein